MYFITQSEVLQHFINREVKFGVFQQFILKNQNINFFKLNFGKLHNLGTVSVKNEALKKNAEAHCVKSWDCFCTLKITISQAIAFL